MFVISNLYFSFRRFSFFTDQRSMSLLIYITDGCGYDLVMHFRFRASLIRSAEQRKCRSCRGTVAASSSTFLRNTASLAASVDPVLLRCYMPGARSLNHVHPIIQPSRSAQRRWGFDIVAYLAPLPANVWLPRVSQLLRCRYAIFRLHALLVFHWSWRQRFHDPAFEPDWQRLIIMPTSYLEFFSLLEKYRSFRLFILF